MFPISRILCAVDFSDGSRHALDHAAALARLFGATVSVFYVHRFAVPVPVAGFTGIVRPVPLTDAERGDIQQSLGEFVADDRKAGIPIDTLFDEDVAVPRAIVQAAAHADADLIVVGTHGHSGFTRMVLGSVANTVMKTAGRPVLIVPPRARDVVPMSFARIVCPVDFSGVSARTLDAAAALAIRSGARLTAMHVLETHGDVSDAAADHFTGYRSERFERARGCLHAVVARLPAGVQVDELLLFGKPYREILRLADDQQADLVVIGIQGKGALEAAAFGSTAYHVVRQATCPTLTVPTA